MYNFGKCGRMRKDSTISLKEIESNFICENPDRLEILEVIVDNCLKFQGKQCDYLLVNTNNNIGLFIELKGNDVEKAVKQLRNSIMQVCSLNNRFIKSNFDKKYAYIVSKKVPGSINPDKIKDKFRKEFSIALKIKNIRLKININNPGKVL